MTATNRWRIPPSRRDGGACRPRALGQRALVAAAALLDYLLWRGHPRASSKLTSTPAVTEKGQGSR